MRLLRRWTVVGVIVFGAVAPAASVGATPASASVEALRPSPDRLVAQASVARARQTATSQIVDVSPSTDGMPGADLIRRLLSWLSQLALWGSLGSILAGATVYGIAQNSNSYNGAFRGKQLAVAGAVGALLAGLAPTAITMLFRAAGG